MRVLVVSTWFPTADRPGVAPFNVAHAGAIARTHDVEVVHLRLGGTGRIQEREVAGLPVTELPATPAAMLAGYRELRRLARGADVVHSMAFSTLGVLAPLFPVVGGRWVHTEHWSGVAFPDRVGGAWPHLAGARHLLRLPRRVGAVSSVLADTVAKFARRDAVEVIPCVVADRFQPAPQPSWTPLKLVAVGGLVAGKRPVLAVDTMRELVDTGTDATLTWVGDGVLRGEVERRIAELGLADRVHLAGAVRPDEVADHLRAANLFFLPTAFETFLAAGAEAIACGRPVVLPGTGGFTDYVTDANGVLTEQDDPTALAMGVRRARDRFADVSADTIRATVIPRFGAAAIADRFDEFYRHLG
ncbi:MAG: glycosyltransferase [Actinophytocola sp.]|uniref:glycosyltransferase family 4 protein n=1 Tax=Actinophytocola sp. TaxID=1872138 RepID=UPI001327029F|nr:glycosyltransferase [Actinophytocola sp.]MPZ81707.1 glycosyltransferase [Actinophytocola sp.]